MEVLNVLTQLVGFFDRLISPNFYYSQKSRLNSGGFKEAF